MKNFLALCLVFFPSLAHATSANNIDAYKAKWETTEAEIAVDPTARDRLLESFRQPASAEEVKAATQFLMTRISNSETDFGYYTAFADLAWNVGKENDTSATKNSAAIVAASAVLILRTDLARCQNPEPGKKAYVDTITRLQEPLYYTQLVEEKTRRLIATEALKFEYKIEKRPGSPVVCGPDASGKVGYIDDAQWMSAREKIRSGFEASLGPPADAPKR